MRLQRPPACRRRRSCMCSMPHDDLGSGFVMDHVAGETVARKILRDEAFASVRPKLARQCGEACGPHPCDCAGIASQRCRASPCARTRRSLRNLQKRTVSPGRCSNSRFAGCAITHRGDPAMPKLVHGDFRNGNLIVGPDGIAAVLDWELAHFGDPMRDLGWVCTNAWRFGEIDKTRRRFRRYRKICSPATKRRAARRIDPDAFKYWIVWVRCAGASCVCRCAHARRAKIGRWNAR